MVRTPITRRPQEGGFVLLIGLFLVILIGGLVVGLIEETNAAKAWLGLHEHNVRALELAETGLIRAEMEIRAQVDHGGDGIGNAADVLDGGTFEVTVHDDPVSDDRWILRARGDFGFAIRRIEVGVRRRVDRHFVEGLFALDDMVLGGDVVTDAYDSSLGSYAAQAVNSDAGGKYARAGGDVGSNADIVVLGTSTRIRGDAIPGPFQETRLTGGAYVAGDMSPRVDLIDIEPEPLSLFEAALATNDNATVFGPGGGNKIRYRAQDMSLDINGQVDFVLPAGTYFFSNVKVQGGARIIVGGPVQIYITGTMDLGGGALVNSGKPSDFSVHAHPYALPEGYRASTSTVKVNGGVDVGMVLYGPQADLVIGGGDHLFGAAVARKIDIGGNVAFHYDTAVQRIGVEGVATLERLYWRDLAPPRR